MNISLEYSVEETFDREKVKIKIEFGEREREWSVWVPNNRRMLW